MTLYYCGWNGCGQLRRQTNIISEPTPLIFDDPIVSVSCSWSILTVATEKTLTVMGFIGNKTSMSRVISFDDYSKAVKVSSTLNHTLVACSNGKCYSYQAETDNLRQLVNFSTSELKNDDTDFPQQDPIVSVSCSANINLALSMSGKVFAIPSHINLPELVVTDISCGNEHSLCLTKSGSVYTWGSGSRGQLGHCDLESEESPRQVEALSGIEVCSISAGSWHNAVVSTSGDLYTWGWGCNGQLGIEEEEDLWEDGNHKVKKLQNDAEAVTSIEKIPEETEKYRGVVQSFPVPVSTPSDVHSVSCGSRHTIVLLVDGNVYGCGWNAYGQLASLPSVFKQVTTLKKITIPGLEQRVSKIQCGGWSSCFIVF